MGSWGTLGPALLSLVGVVLGAGGSFFGQYLMSRASSRQVDVQESAAHRAELKDAVLKFLSIASQVEKATAARSQSVETASAPALDQLVDDLWLAQKGIDLAARSEPLRGATYRYAASLTAAARGEVAEASALGRLQAQFMDAAYDDMWPRQRRTAEASITAQ
ncbi:hypothetical protein AB0J57_32210 [Streptomyces sp. NPDC049837]|uniref:hypothetical protein n=1 Tax=Streptomyces sp. NPDC049837 TaxID=3155277 RepID=UPI0034163197